ncbi:MAG: tetratricopeptide repeat protein [candidate division Zixibacteria bacterium]|nr:tetratricopeptide repeat protein [candidate division Zixibacteria bacterium]
MKTKKKHTNRAEYSSEKDEKAKQWERVAVAGAILLLVILGISSFLPTQRLWGVNHLSYYPLWFRALVIFLGVLAFIPLVNQSLQGFLKKSVIPAFSFLVEKRKYLGYSIIILLFTLFFYLFRTRTHFLGDGATLISYINSGTLSVKWTQPLAYRIYLSAYDSLNKLFHFDGTVVYALISCLCGIVFVFFALRLADLLGKTASTKLFVFLALTFMGGTQLFLGYAEHYPLFYCGILIYLFFSIKCLKGETKLFLPLLFFLILLPMHFFSLYLFPSAIFLFLFVGAEGKTKPTFKIKKIWIVSPVLILIFASLIIYFLKYGWYSLVHLVPLFKGRYSAPNHTLFSPPHLLDFLNQQLLVSPIGFLLFLIFLILRPKSRDSKDKIFQFLLVVSISQLFFNFVLDPGLGAARDWDLFASVGLGYTVLSLYVFGKMSPNPRISYLKLGLTIIVFISTLPWMGINASADLSVRRFRNLLNLDPRKSPNGHFVLCKYFKTKGQEEEIKKQIQVQRELIPELLLIAEGKKFLVKGELDSAETKFLLAKEIAPGFNVVHDNLGMVYFVKGELNKAETGYKRAIKLGSFVPSPYFNLATLYAVKGDMDRALKLYKKAVILKCPYPEAYYNLGLIYFRKGDLDKAEDFFRRTLERKSDFADAYVGLGNIYKERGELQKAIKMYQAAIQLKPDLAKEEAIRELERFLELAPQSENAEKVRNILQELRQ